MQYHGGIVFGKAVNKPGKLANTIYSTVSHTCRGLVELCKHLLNTTHHEYVMLGKFTSDPIEKEFGKLRQGSGGTYFITVQQMFEKIAITKTKFLLRLDADNDFPNLEAGHSCSKCGFHLSEDTCTILDNLHELESSLSVDTIMTFWFI